MDILLQDIYLCDMYLLVLVVDLDYSVEVGVH